jgi:Arylsulfotransferase (ASST)
VNGIDRRALFRRGASAGLGLLLLDRLPDPLRATAAEAASGDGVRRFVSRPDLEPPAIEVSRAGPNIATGSLFLSPSSGPGQRGVLIVDDRGEPVWFHSTSPKTATNFRMALYRGRPVLSWWEGITSHGLGVGEHVVFDRTYRELARFPAGDGLGADLHELIVTPAGTALIAAYDVAPADLSPVGGSRRGHVIDGIVQELEIPSARVLFEWRSTQHVGLEESYSGVNDARFDFFHLNAIDLHRDGDLLVSARNTWTVYKVSRETGRVLWRLGGKKSDFKLGPGAHFAWQHDARHHPDDDSVITLFDNADAPQEEPQSRGLSLALDMKRKTASLRHQYTHNPTVLAHMFGSVQTQPNGNVLVGWGASQYFTEYSADGQIRLDAGLPPGGENYRTLRFPWTGAPAEPPRIAAHGGQLYASWNGATSLAAWQLHAGADKSRLRPKGIVVRRGFETELAVPSGARYVAVTALDDAHQPLRTSAVLRL